MLITPFLVKAAEARHHPKSQKVALWRSHISIACRDPIAIIKTWPVSCNL